MAIAVDATSNHNGQTGTTLTFAHTCSADTTMLVVIVGGTTTLNTTAVTYNGTSMTKQADNGSQMECTVWTLENPDTGSSYNIVVTKGNNEYVQAAGISLEGAGSANATGTANGFSTSASVTVNTNSSGDGMVVAGVAWNDAGGLITYTGGGTEFTTESDGVFGSSYSHQAYSSGGNITETWTKSSSNRSWGCAGVEIEEASSVDRAFGVMTIF